MAEVQAEHVHPGQEEPAHHVLAAARRPERRYDLRVPRPAHVSSFPLRHHRRGWRGSRSRSRVYNDSMRSHVSRLMLPVSLTYDHRAIDGVAGGRLKFVSAAAATPVSAPRSWPRSRPAARSTTSRTRRRPPPGAARPARRRRSRRARTRPAPPRSRRRRARAAGRSRRARRAPCSVASGIVFTVNGAASALMYSTSEALGSLVPVLAHSSRCGRRPERCRCAASAASAEQRRDSAL